MTNKKTGQVKACYDNSEDGIPNFCIDLIDGTRLYSRGEMLNPKPEKGDTISYNVINTKESKNGNPYSNVSSVKVVDGEATEATTSVSSKGNMSNRQELLMFVTGITGRWGQSGQYPISDMDNIVANAVKSFNNHLLPKWKP